MAYVVTESQSRFVKSERDLAGFEASYFRRVDRIVESMVAPQRTEQHRDERGRPFTVHLHAVTGRVLNVTA